MPKYDRSFAYHRLSHSGVGTRELNTVSTVAHATVIGAHRLVRVGARASTKQSPIASRCCQLGCASNTLPVTNLRLPGALHLFVGQ